MKKEMKSLVLLLTVALVGFLATVSHSEKINFAPLRLCGTVDVYQFRYGNFSNKGIDAAGLLIFFIPIFNLTVNLREIHVLMCWCEL